MSSLSVGAGRLRPARGCWHAIACRGGRCCGRGGRSVLRRLAGAALLLLAALASAAFTVPAVAQTSATLCEPSNNRELWCGTMTVGVTPTKGGYSRFEGLGAITPGSFTWRGATVKVTELSRNLPIGDNSEVTLQFSLEVASGAVPSGGLLGSQNFTLFVRIGNGIDFGVGFDNPGTNTSFSLPVEAEFVSFVRDSLHWHPGGVEVQVRLVREGADSLDESIVSDPGSDKTYAAGETITVQLEMSESVFVTGRPHIWLDVGGVRRKAIYSGPVGTAATELDFSYTVQAGDSDTDGVAVVRTRGNDNDIQLNGGSIRAAVDETDALLEILGLEPQSGHKVDAAEAFLSSTRDCESEVRAPSGWALTPSGLNAGDKFRLLFVTSTKRDASHPSTSPYNVFVQDRAAAGHASIRPFRRGFWPVVSTGSTNARDHTCTTGTGVPIHWLGGNKVVDSYTDFYDGSWDDRTNWRDENGNALSPGKVWTGSNDNGTKHSSRHMGDSMVAGSDGASSSAKPLTGADGSNSEQRHLYGLSQVFKVATSTEGPSTSSIELTGSRASGDIFGLGESVGITVTFSEAVTVRGSPRIGLLIGEIDDENDGEYEAAFVGYGRTDGNADRTKLIFGFVVPSGLHDADGIEVHSTALRLKGGEILARLDGLPARWTIAARENLGGSVNSLLVRTVGGVCDRTPVVSNAIVAALSESGVELCSQVTAAHLAGMTTLSIEGLTSPAVGDFAGLSGLQDLTINGTGIDTLPVGLFDGLDSLEELYIQVGLTHLPKDIFRGLGKVWRLRVEGQFTAGRPRNYLRAGGLPDGIFEPLADVTERIRQGRTRRTEIFGNPGYPAFFSGGAYVAPSLSPRAADAGPGGTLSAGQTVILGGPGNDGGIWGSNVTYEWKQRDGMGAAADIVTLSNGVFFGFDNDYVITDVPNPGFTAPALAEETEVRLSLRLDGGRGNGAKYDGSVHELAAELLGLWSPPSEARFTILGLAPTDVAVASTPVSGTSYRLGEAIEVAVTFGDRVLVDTSQGTPTLALTVGTQTRQASYVRGTGTTQLVFAYTVVAADSDTDGIAVAADALALNGGAITGVYGVPALLDHDAVVAQSGHGADGSQTPGFSLTDGVCGRTGQVRDKLVDLVNDVAANSAVTNCSLVTETHLGALIGTLDLSSAGIAALKAGDFAGLGGISVLNLNDNALPTLPARVFEPLAGLTTLRLNDNALPTLPARVFEPLTGLTTLTLAGNPGAAGFAPQAVSGPAGGFDAVSGGSVTLGVEGAAAGQDDPWGSNVTYAWSLTEGTGGTLTAETAARADFAAPVTAENGTHTVRLTVTGAGGSFVGTDDATVRVAAGPKVERVSFATLALSAGGPAYTADGVVSVTLGFDRAVTVATADGTPSVSLTVGTATKTAGYLSGTGTRSLTFGYTVVAADTDTDGVDVAADSLALNGGRITGVSDGGAAALGHAGLAGGSERPVNGSGAPVVSGGICGRTAAVQAAVLARVRTAEDDATLACGAVTPTMLTALAGRLDVSAQVAAHGRMTALKAGDFAWLANVTALDLDRHALRSFPAGVFDGLAALQELSVAYNQTQAADRMTTLPAGLFDRLTKLTTLGLEHNDLVTLPDGIFERLTRLTTLTFDGNPGSASFLPVAVAGPAGGFDAEAGDLVTLGGAPGGLWGGNLVHAWRQVAGPTGALSASNVAAPSFTAPALGRAVALEYELTATGRGTRRTATDSVTVRVAPSAVVASLAAVSGPVSGDTYRRGETIGVAVTFGKPVAVTGTPQLALSVGSATRQAAYARGTGTTQLAFEYTVVEADRDPDGIAVAANALALNNGTIADAGGAAADLGHGALAAQSGHKVDGSLAGLTGGICGRTPEVRDALLVRVRTVNAGLSCAQVTITHLGALTGTLSLPGRSIRALRPGDFTGLANVTALDLGGNELASLPAGVFAGLDDTLTSLDLSDNDLVSLSAGLFGPLTGLTTLDLSDNGLAALPTGLFGPLTGLTTLDLSDNGLAALPARLFEQLTGLTALTLSGNPGSARFRPVARAGPEGGIDVAQGATVTLGAAGAAAGFDDPWGSNVAWAWTRTAGTTVSYASDKGADTARPEFTAPSADETMTFTLTVTGQGGITATDTVSVRVGTAGMRPMPKSAAVNGATLTLIYDEVLQTASPASATGKGPVYLAVVRGPGAQRSIKTARPTAATASGRTVTMTLDPPAASNETVTLSYYPDNATADSSVRDRGGNLANGFTGFQVRNDTPEGPHVDDIAFAGAGKTYGIGDMVEVDVTFSEAVTVTGQPTLALEVGAATRKAGWKIGQGASAVQRFVYTVAADDLDTDGLAVKANGLETPSGSSIVAQAEAVILRHGSFSDPAHKVDGVLPTADAAVSAGPTVTVTWSEALDAAAVPTGAGGFTVRIATADGPAVTAVAVSGSTTVLSLASAIAEGTQNVTLEYAPPDTGAKIRDAVGNDAAAIARTDPLAVEVTADTRAPEVLGAPTVDGATLIVTFDEALDAASVPAAPGGFTVTVTRGGSTVSGHTVSALSLSSSGTVLTLTLAQGVLMGDAVVLAYAKPSTPLRDRAVTPNDVADFTTGSGDVLAVVNGIGALELALSKATAVEGEDATVTLTVAVEGSGTSRAARVIAVAASGTPTAKESEDWTLDSATATLGEGATSVAFAIAIVDDARLEAEESVTFAVSADGAAVGEVTLTVADDDRAVLAVVGPEDLVTEGGTSFTLALRLEPHPENGPPVAGDACIVDFPVTAALSVAGGASELTGSPSLPGEYTFAATAFDDCTREVAVALETRASDGDWAAERTVSFALARTSGQDARIDPGEAQVTVRDDTPPPGPRVETVDMPAPPPGAPELTGSFRTRKAFYDRDAVPDDAVHGAGATLTFTLRFDHAVTVEGGHPELVLDVWKRARGAQLATPDEERSDTRTLAFAWTVAKGDNDPDGIRIAGLDLNGARIRLAAGCQQDAQGNDLPCDMDLATFAAQHGKTYPEHRVRGGLHTIRLAVEGDASEGEPFAFAATRDGGYAEETYAIVTIEDSAFPDRIQYARVDFAAGRAEDEGVARARAALTPGGDGAADPHGERRLALSVGTTEVGNHVEACVFAGPEETCSQWYDTPEGGDGTPVTFSVAVTDQGHAGGLPSLAVRDAYAGGEREPTRERFDRGEDYPLSFDVRLSEEATGTVTVDYATADGTATAGADYVAASGTLTFAPGETVKFVEVRVLPDDHDEGSETMRVVLSNAAGAVISDAEGVGTIFNDGPIPRAWVARFGRTVAEQVLEAVEGRMRVAPAPGVEVSVAGARVGGEPRSEEEAAREARREVEEEARRGRALAHWLAGETEPGEGLREARAVTGRELLTGSSFALGTQTAGKDLVSLWGAAAVSRFDAREGELTLDGEVATGMLGGEWTRGSGAGAWTAGLVVSHSVGEGGWSGAQDGARPGASGRVEAMLTGLFPWARHVLGERFEAWGAVGVGAGALTVTPKLPGTDEDGAPMRAGLELKMAAAGLRATLLGGDGEDGALTATTDALAVRTASGRARGADGGNLEPSRAVVTRLRFGLEASRPIALGSAAVLTPSLDTGVRHDGGDAETGFGLDLGGGLVFSNPALGLEAELRGRGLLSHESRGLRERGFSGALAWRERPSSERGAVLTLTQTVGGASSGGAQALLSRATLDGLAASDAAADSDDLASRHLELKLGYGVAAFGGRFTWTPQAAAGLSSTGRDLSLGWRLTGGPGGDSGAFELSFEATRRESAIDDARPEHDVRLAFTARF